MQKVWPQKQLIHMLPFNPSTGCLRTCYIDANKECSMVIIDMLSSLTSEEPSGSSPPTLTSSCRRPPFRH
eukprot:12915038-Prorocentrum_lima.AAC.1